MTYLKLTVHYQGESELQDGSFFPSSYADLRAVVVVGGRGFIQGMKGVKLRAGSNIELVRVWYTEGRERTIVRTDAGLAVCKELAPRRGPFIHLHAEIEVKWGKGQALAVRVRESFAGGGELEHAINGDSAGELRRKLVINLGKEFGIEAQDVGDEQRGAQGAGDEASPPAGAGDEAPRATPTSSAGRARATSRRRNGEGYRGPRMVGRRWRQRSPSVWWAWARSKAHAIRW
jgi:hypothetical protein